MNSTPTVKLFTNLLISSVNTQFTGFNWTDFISLNIVQNFTENFITFQLVSGPAG